MLVQQSCGHCRGVIDRIGMEVDAVSLHDQSTAEEFA